MVWLAAIAVLAGGCSTQYYMPNMQQVPLLREMGEGRGAVALVSDATGDASGFDVQASAAVTDHTGLLFNACHYRGGDREYRSSHQVNGWMVDGGVGRFQPLGRHWVAEGYGGFTYGGMNASEYEYRSTLNFWRGFVQPSIGYASRNFDFAVAARLCYVDHFNATVNWLVPGEHYLYELNAVLNDGRFLFEPGALLRFGTRYLKVQVQFVHAFNLSAPMPYLEENWSLGLQLNLNNSFAPRVPPVR